MKETDSMLLNDYLERSQLCEQLGVSARTLHRWDGLKIGPPVTRLGRRTLYKRSSVEVWLRDIEGKDMAQLEKTAQRAAHERGLQRTAQA